MSPATVMPRLRMPPTWLWGRGRGRGRGRVIVPRSCPA